MNRKNLGISLILCLALILGRINLVAAQMPSAEPTATLLVSGLAGGGGSAIGPGGALFVTEGLAGRISRVGPRTGEVTTFTSGLPLRRLGNGGVMDVAFIGSIAYALVTLVGPDIGGNSTVGIYRIDGPTSYTVIADIGAWSIQNPPTIPFPYSVPSGVQYSLEPYRGGFLVTDGHLNRLLHVTLDGEISVMRAFGNIVPTGLEVHGNTIYMAEAGPTPHLSADGKVVAFEPDSNDARSVASGRNLLVDVERGRGTSLYALAQGEWKGTIPGSPALPNKGELVGVNSDGTFTTIVAGINRPTSLEFIGNTAYVVTLSGEIWKIDNVSESPFGGDNQGTLLGFARAGGQSGGQPAGLACTAPCP